MKKIISGLVLLFASMQAAQVHGQSSKYPPLSEYMMTPEAEVALARSAAPEDISGFLAPNVSAPRSSLRHWQQPIQYPVVSSRSVQ